MNNTQLETFVRVVEAGSFNKASEEMFITSTAHSGGKFALQGLEIHNRIYARNGFARAPGDERKRKCYTHRHVAHDSGADFDGLMAEDTRALPRYSFSVDPIREHARKRERDPRKSRSEHRYCDGYFR